jgi:hypothetical protein
MKDLKTTFTGGHPFQLDDLAHIQNGIRDAFEGLGLAIGGNVDPMVLFGALVYEDGGNSHVTKGMILVGAELMMVAASTVSGAFGATIELQVVEEYESPSPVTYENLAARDVHRNRKVVLGRSSARPTEFVSAIDPFTVKRVRGAWVQPTLGSNWNHTDANGQGGALQYSPDYLLKKVEFRGCVHWDTGNQPGSGVVFTLPSGLRPATKQIRAIFSSASMTGAGFLVNDKTYVLIDTNGQVTLDTNLGADLAYRLDGVSFHI